MSQIYYRKIPDYVVYFICFALNFSHTLHVLTIQIKLTYWKNGVKTNMRG